MRGERGSGQGWVQARVWFCLWELQDFFKAAPNTTLSRAQTLGISVSLYPLVVQKRSSRHRFFIVGQTLRRRQLLRSGQSQDCDRWSAGNIQSARLCAPLAFDLERRTATFSFCDCGKCCLAQAPGRTALAGEKTFPIKEKEKEEEVQNPVTGFL